MNQHFQSLVCILIRIELIPPEFLDIFICFQLELCLFFLLEELRSVPSFHFILCSFREDGTLINDGDHDMMVYKVTSSLLTKDGDMPKFLGSEFKDLKPLVPLTRDEIRITKVMYCVLYIVCISIFVIMLGRALKTLSE